MDILATLDCGKIRDIINASPFIAIIRCLVKLAVSHPGILATIDPVNTFSTRTSSLFYLTRHKKTTPTVQFLEFFNIVADGSSTLTQTPGRANGRRPILSWTSPSSGSSLRGPAKRAENGSFPSHVRWIGPPLWTYRTFSLQFTFDTTCNLIFGVDPGWLTRHLPSCRFEVGIDDADDVMFFQHAAALGNHRQLLGRLVSQRMEQVAKVREDMGTQ